MAKGESRQQAYARKYGISFKEAGEELYKQRITRAMAKGKTYTEARRGTTPEHGRLLPRNKITIFPGGRTEGTYSDTKAEQLVERAERHGNRVQIFVHTKKGPWVMLGGTRGYSASYIGEQTAKAGSLRGAVGAGEIYDGSDLAVIDPAKIDAWQITEFAA